MYKLNKKNNKKIEGGFTLIELLVVIAIISLLSSVIMVSVQDARNKARVAKVKSDFVQIRNAAELYKSDTGNYPAQITDLVPKYITRIPTDPFYLASASTEFPQINTAYAFGGGIGVGGGGFITTPNKALYSLGTSTATSYCGTSANQSVENGKFFVSSQNNIGIKNIGAFSKFKVSASLVCLGCPPFNIIYNTESAGIIPCLD